MSDTIESLDEALQRIIDDNNKYVDTFNKNYTFEMKERFNGQIKHKVTGRTYGFKTFRGMKMAFKKAAMADLKNYFNPYIAGAEISGTKLEHW